MRDIFLQPFNYRLLLCVAVTFIFIVAAMEATNYVVTAILHNDNERDTELGEATLWCLSIMCMQGEIQFVINKSITVKPRLSQIRRGSHSSTTSLTNWLSAHVPQRVVSRAFTVYHKFKSEGYSRLSLRIT